MSDKPTESRVGAVINNKWRIDRHLGSGGMATVFAATHRNGNKVALKILRRSLSKDLAVRERFLREGYIANSVGHEGVVKVLDDGVTSDGAYFLVMELLEGESVEARRVRLGGKLPVEEVFTIGEQLLDLLSHAHKQRIIHRDIKPDNIFITHDGSVKLLDFGVARMPRGTTDTTTCGLMLGTPDFMAPEQVIGDIDAIDGRSDIYALGATMFLLVAGEPVHPSFIAAATKPARSLAVAAPGAPWPLVTVIDRAVALRPDDRWTDAREMQRALRLAYHGARRAPEQTLYIVAPEPPMEEKALLLQLPPSIVAKPKPKPEPKRRRRHRAVVVAAIVLALPFLGPVTGVIHVDEARAVGVAPAPPVSSAAKEEPTAPRLREPEAHPDTQARACRGPCTNVPD